MSKQGIPFGGSTVTQIPTAHGVCALTPWYINGTLSSSEASEVEKHLPGCKECRDSIVLLGAISTSVKNDTSNLNELENSAASFEKLMSQIDSADSSAPIKYPDTTHPISTTSIAPPRHKAYGIAASLALFLVFGAGMIADQQNTWDYSGSLIYRTLSDASASNSNQVTEGSQLYRVLFHRDTTDTQIQMVLAKVAGQMSAGPTPRGVYTIQVSSADVIQKEVLETLRGQPQVILAELVTQ